MDANTLNLPTTSDILRLVAQQARGSARPGSTPDHARAEQRLKTLDPAALERLADSLSGARQPCFPTYGEADADAVRTKLQGDSTLGLIRQVLKLAPGCDVLFLRACLPNVHPHSLQKSLEVGVKGHTLKRIGVHLFDAYDASGIFRVLRQIAPERGEG